jgi:cell division protease FtsH
MTSSPRDSKPQATKNTDGTPPAAATSKIGGFGRLAATHARHLRDTDIDLPYETEDQIVSQPPPKAPRRHARRTVVETAMEAAVTATVRKALSAQTALAVVVSVPSASWIGPLESFFQEHAYGKAWKCFARDGSQRQRDKPSVGNSEVAGTLASGRSVVGIAVVPELVLPSTLVAAADIRIDLTLDSRVVRNVVRKLCGKSGPRITDRDLVGLDLDDVVAALRPDTTAREMVARIRSAARSVAGAAGAADAPDLVTAVEYGEARQWGLALARDMREYRQGTLPWSAVDRGAIFHSGPGMGKSVLARSLARACDVALVVGSVGELFAASTGHLDGVIKSLRELFAKAVAAAPCILFLDEIDGLPSRESLDSRNRDFWMPIIEDFLMLLDDATSARREGVVVIGATNRIAAVDPAILRPGRLERAIELTPPDSEGIENILRFHAPDLRDDDLRSVAGLLEGFTPAEIMETVRSARRAARTSARDLSADDLRRAVMPATTIPPAALERIAIHEAGHVVVAIAAAVGRVRSVRIGGRQGVGGVTSIDPSSSDLATRQSIERQIVGILAGRAAEIVLLGAPSVGSGGSERSDLALATRLVASMELSLGVGESGLVFVGDAERAFEALRLNPNARYRVDKMLRQLQARACGIVEKRKEQVLAIADALIEKSFLSGEEIEQILAGKRADEGDILGAADTGSILP